MITYYQVYDERPSDRHLLLPAVKAHQRKLGQVSRMVATDTGYDSRANEDAAHALGVKYVSIQTGAREASSGGNPEPARG